MAPPGPLAGSAPPPATHAALAELAFGDLTATNRATGTLAPLALLPADALELDLDDPLQRQFGAYELVERLGEGGMGVVYRARHIELDREVAIKLLAAGPWASREFVERFLAEARHSARMQHPNIVTVYEVGTSEDLHFFSMRLVPGRSLAAALQTDGPCTPRHAATLLHTVAEAVAYAHSLGVLHLDLKSANVLLDAQGTPHVADFGLARRFEPLREIDATEISGTPGYMAPEQAEPGTHALTPASDVWGLGAILYELVTGTPPFRGDDARSTLQLLRTTQVQRPRQLRARIPLDLEAIILKCLRRDPAQRYASARALADDLARYAEDRPVSARPLNTVQRAMRWLRREPRLAGATLLALAALVAGLVATTQQWRRADANALRAAANAAQARANALQASERLWNGRRERALQLMRDGEGLTALPLLVDNIAEQEQAGKVDPASVERRGLGMILNQGAILIDRIVIPDVKPLASALSADGSLLALAFDDSSVRWYDSATLTERGRVQLSGRPTSDGSARLPRRLRFIDAQRLLVTLDWFDYLASPSHNDSHLVDLARARVVAPPDAFVDLAEAVYSADGRHALLRNRRGDLQLWQVDPWRALAPASHAARSNAWAALLGRDTRFVAEKQEDARGYLTLRDPHGAARAQPVRGLDNAVTAWAENAAGTQLAIGDSRGRVHLVDLRTRVARLLPTPRGREVTWLAFSEDDAWLAAVRWDGAAFAFDAASGDPLHSGPLQHDFEPREVAIDHRQRLLVVAGLGHTALWQLPEQGPNALPATRLLAAPARTGPAGTNALGIAPAARLLASAALNGEVRIWRIAPAPRRTSQTDADLRMADRLHFDGASLTDVAWNRVRRIDTQGRPITPWRPLPQPPGFVEASADGKVVVASSGPALHILDGATLEPLRAPVALPDNPQYLALDARGRHAVLGFGRNDANGYGIDIQSIDLHADGQRAHVRVRGPLRQFELAADGERLLVTGPPHGATEVLATPSLKRIGVYPHPRGRPVTWASFVPASQALWLLARDADDNAADDADLLRWNPRDGRIEEQRHVAGVFPLAVTMVGDKPLLATRDRLVLDAGTSGAISSRPLEHVQTTGVFAHSHDGRMLAQVIGRDVQLYDSTTLAPIGPPLRSGAGPYALPFRLAFAPDDRTLLGGFRPWLLWPVAADTRPVAELRAQAHLLLPADSDPRLLELPDPAQRARLRAADPGPPPTAAVRPTFDSARSVSGLPIPARSGATPLQLDLTAFYNRPADLLSDMSSSSLPNYVGMRLGITRIDGVDYDLRGAVELRTQGSAGHDRVTGIEVPDLPIAALHVLLLAPLAVPTPEVRTYAWVHLHYADGSSAQVPIRTRIEVSGLTDDEPPTPIGWVTGEVLRQIGLTRLQLFHNPRLPNPHPQRRVLRLDLETPADAWSNPVFLAISIEPVPTARAAAASRRIHSSTPATRAPGNPADAESRRHAAIDP